MQRANVIGLAAILSGMVLGQTADPKPAFEMADVHITFPPHQPQPPCMSKPRLTSFRAARFIYISATCFERTRNSHTLFVLCVDPCVELRVRFLCLFAVISFHIASLISVLLVWEFAHRYAVFQCLT